MRSRTQPSDCAVAENHTAQGTTVEAGQYLPTRSVCSTPFCRTHTTVFSSHNRSSQTAAAAVWVSFTARSTTSTGSTIRVGSTSTGSRSVIDRPSRIPSSGLSSSDSRGVRPHTTTCRPAAWSRAARVVPIAPGPTTAMEVLTKAKVVVETPPLDCCRLV
ncbi:hypothetical protein TUM20985_32590 [Mycobacterium antarcticum]|nr:hypothetical protein TUM20985_32590 [Mycolicibacterium sp. TUM20985]